MIESPAAVSIPSVADGRGTDEIHDTVPPRRHGDPTPGLFLPPLGSKPGNYHTSLPALQPLPPKGFRGSYPGVP